MRTEELQCFQSIYSYRNFSRAAENLYLSQSALSKQIKSLEKELGVTLFKRSHSGIVPTEIGLAVAPHFEKILSELDLVNQICHTGNQRRTSQLKIATFFNVSYSPIAVNMIQFEQQIPGFHIETFECSHSQMNNLLLKNSKIEICFGFSELWNTFSAYAVHPLMESPLALVVNARHPFANRKSVHLSETKNEYYCFSKEDTALFDYYISCCKTAGFSPLLTNSTVRFGIIKQYIAANIRCTLLPKIVASEYFSSPRFRIIEVDDALPLTLAMAEITHDSRSYGSALVKEMTEAFCSK